MMNLSFRLPSFAPMEAGLPDHIGPWNFANALRMEYPGMSPPVYRSWWVGGIGRVSIG